MDEDVFQRRLDDISQIVEKIKRCDIRNFDKDEELAELDETTQKFMALNVFERDAKSLIQALKSSDLTPDQHSRLQTLEKDLMKAHEAAAAAHISERDKPKEETAPFLPQYSKLKQNVTENTPRKQSQPTNIRDLKRLTRLVSTDIQKLKATVSKISGMVGQIGTINDSRDLEQALSEQIRSAHALVNNIMTTLTNINVTLPEQTDSEQRKHKESLKNLMQDYKETTSRLQAVEKEAMSKQREFLQQTDSEWEANLPEQRLQQQTLTAIEIEDIKERHDALKKLEQDIVDLNHIFKDLANMTQEQGEKIDSIEVHVEAAVEHTENGKKKLDSAKRSNESRRKKILICATVGIIFLITLIVIVIISVS